MYCIAGTEIQNESPIKIIAQAYQMNKKNPSVDLLIERNGIPFLAMQYSVIIRGRKPFFNPRYWNFGNNDLDNLQFILDTVIDEASQKGFVFPEHLNDPVKANICHKEILITSPDPDISAIYQGNNLLAALRTARDFLEEVPDIYVKVAAFNMRSRSEDGSMILGIDTKSLHQTFIKLITHIGEYYS